MTNTLLTISASAAVGLCTVQLARLSGFKVVATASPHNFSLVKDYGATEVINYKDAGVVQKVKEVTGDTIKNALDAISERETQPITVDSIAPSGGKVVVLLRPATDVIARKDVEVIRTIHYFGMAEALLLTGPSSDTLLYTALGRAFDFGPDTQYPASLEDKAQIVQFLKKLPQLVLEGAVKPLPVKLWEGGLEAIPDGLQYMREGKVSAEKIVYRLQ